MLTLVKGDLSAELSLSTPIEGLEDIPLSELDTRLAGFNLISFRFLYFKCIFERLIFGNFREDFEK
jgi:hypothetical protein